MSSVFPIIVSDQDTSPVCGADSMLNDGPVHSFE